MTEKISLLVLVCVLFLSSCAEKKEPSETYTLLVGTYTDGASNGIYKYSFDAETGTLDSLQLMAQLPNPSFLAVSKDQERVYAVQETADFDSLGGGVTAFTYENGLFNQLNSKGTGGAHPCHVALSDDGHLAVSNYTGGNLAVFDLQDDGSLGKRQIIDHKISDTTKTAHVHKAHFNADGLLASDLGLDALKRYVHKEGQWIPALQASIALPEGAGPRHFDFNTDGSFLYGINELNATITVFTKDKEGAYQKLQTVSTVDSGFKGSNACADIHLSPDGRFLYGSNRGENSIVIFSVDATSGKLQLVGRESVQGNWPRNFTLDHTGNFLLVANQKSDNITVFKRNPENGTLAFSHEVALSMPVCLVFME